MGSLYRPKYKAADGTWRESAVWWAYYRQHAKRIRQSTQTADYAKAMAFLRQQEGKVALKIPVHVEADRLTLKDGAAMIRQDYQANGRKSAATLEHRLAPLVAHFGEAARLSRLSTGAIERYKAVRLATHAPATVNRELACLSRMATLARKQHGLVVSYVVDGLAERNVRQGFFDDGAFHAVCRALPPHLAALAAVARLTGWRKSELRSREWRHVDFKAGWLRMEPEETKNRDGRMFPLIPELRAVLAAQRAAADVLQREKGIIVRWVFFRPDGAPAGDFKRAWTTARRKAGVPGRIFHDFRRTAVRNLVRAGIPEVVAMKMTGHLTNAVFKRYAIVDEGMLAEAGAKLAASTVTGAAATAVARER